MQYWSFSNGLHIILPKTLKDTLLSLFLPLWYMNYFLQRPFAFQGCMMILFHFKMFLFFLLKLGRHQELRCSNYYMCSWTLIYTKFLFLFSTKKEQELCRARTTDTQWRHESKKFENLGRCGKWSMLQPNLKIWDWELIFGHAMKAISSTGVRSPWCRACVRNLDLRVQSVL